MQVTSPRARLSPMTQDQAVAGCGEVTPKTCLSRGSRCPQWGREAEGPCCSWGLFWDCHCPPA